MKRNVWNKRTREEVQNIVEGLGYKLLNEYMNGKSRKVVIEDRIGYKYDVALYDVVNGHPPRIFGKNNPFSLSNISLWLEKENKPFALCKNNVYNGNEEKLLFLCLNESCRESFDISWHHIYIAGCGCPFCAGKRVGKRNNLNYKKPDLSKEWDYEKNEKTPKEYTYGSRKIVFWICFVCKHSWKTSILNRYNGSGCPKCSLSEGEDKISKWLEKNKKELKSIGFTNKVIPQKNFF